ncbi:MAG: Mur ligase domain-containing protein [Vampirovibrionales bacterium]|nr:Mur ligase domain-containing protein [Vampirovibrionales bacterium]
MRPAQFPTPTLTPGQAVHFIGAGGVGMSALATLLAQRGYRVSGSDIAENGYTQKLNALGGQVFIGPHNAKNLPESALVVISTAISPENPEFALARERGQVVCHRSGLLKAILQDGALGIAFTHTVGITGTHGKTTLTAMAGWLLEVASVDPTIIAGGKLLAWQHTSKLSTQLSLDNTHEPVASPRPEGHAGNTIAIAELDESDGSLIAYQPTLSVLTNLELDHAEHFPGGIDELEAHFVEYVRNLHASHTVIINDGCPRLKRLFIDAPEDQLKQIKATLRALSDYPIPKAIYLPFPGEQYQLNARMALAIAAELGVSQTVGIEALSRYPGVGRRLEKLGEHLGFTLWDDYAHHPTEVLVTLGGMRERLPAGARLIAVFQPHRYTRLQALWDEFLTCFDTVDTLLLAPVYAAHEPELNGITHTAFADALRARQTAQACALAPSQVYATSADWHEVRTQLEAIATPGDWIVTLGAGDITFLLRRWVQVPVAAT